MTKNCFPFLQVFFCFARLLVLLLKQTPASKYMKQCSWQTTTTMATTTLTTAGTTRLISFLSISTCSVSEVLHIMQHKFTTHLLTYDYYYHYYNMPTYPKFFQVGWISEEELLRMAAAGWMASLLSDQHCESTEDNIPERSINILQT